MPKSFEARVTTYNAEVEFRVKSGIRGNAFHTRTCNVLGLREPWFFGLTQIDEKGNEQPVRPKKKISPSNKNAPTQFKLNIRYYPEDVVEELIDDCTLRLFYYEVKKKIVNQEIYCPVEAAILLAAYQALVRHGTYDKTLFKPGFLNVPAYLPAKFFDDYKLSHLEWEDKILKWYSELDMGKEDAMMEYLKIAQDLDMYGVTYFNIRNSKQTELLLGVQPLGLSVYPIDNPLTPSVNFAWNETSQLQHRDKKFIVKPSESNSKDLIFTCQTTAMSKYILDLCTGNHELYARRRGPDSIEVQQMKAQAKEMKLRREQEREKLQAERRKYEMLGEEHERVMREMRERDENYEMSQRTLTMYEERVLSLQAQLEEEKRLRLASEEAQNRLEEINKRLAEKTAANQQGYNDLVAERDQLHKTLSENKQALENLQIAKEEVEDVPDQADESDPEKQDDSDEAVLADLKGLARPEDEREVMENTDPDYAEQMAQLRKDLENARSNQPLSKNDMQHAENVRQGKDKYRTLREIRKGNTKKRAEYFEAM